jgi:hypothetical protein
LPVPKCLKEPLIHGIAAGYVFFVEEKRLQSKWCRFQYLGHGRIGRFYRIKQVSLLQHPAEILFTCNVLCSSFAGRAGQGFVFHFEPFQPHNADEFPAALPELALTQLHAKTIRLELAEHDLSLRTFSRLEGFEAISDSPHEQDHSNRRRVKYRIRLGGHV